jgi:polysaccharide export outer membrane protein
MSRSKSDLRPRAIFLLLLVLYAYAIVPTVAASLAVSGNDTSSDANQATSTANTTGSAATIQKDTTYSASEASPPASTISDANPVGETSKYLSQKLTQSKPPRLVPPPPAEGLNPDQMPAPSPTPEPDSLSHRQWLETPPSAPGVDLDYILGPGDYLTIQDYSSGEGGQPVIQTSNPILPDGTIDAHPVGIVKAAGLSLREFTELVNRLAQRYIIKPDIEVSVTKIRPNTVYILGEIVKPGLYTNETVPLMGAENVVSQSANLTVVSALQRAGGLKQSADVRNIRVSRLGAKEQKKVNLWQLITEGDVTQDFVLMSGDVIFVPKGGSDFDPESLGLAADLHRRVRILGAVHAPGLVDMSPDDDVLSVIAKAGGFSATATKKWVLLSRMNRDGTLSTRKISISQAIKDPDATARLHIKPNDLILVHDSLLKKGANTAYTVALYTTSAMWLIVWSNIMSKAFFPQSSSSSGTAAVIPATTIPQTSSSSSTAAGTQ